MKELVQKLIRMRKEMVRRGVSQKNPLRVHRSIILFSNYFERFPKVSESTFKGYCKKHIEDLQVLLPGKGSSSYHKLNQELTQLLSL